MKTITFIRHGQSIANAGGVTMANDQIYLTELGQRQAAVLAEHLPIPATKIMASTYLRTQQTAAPFCDKVQRPLDIHPLLHEFDTIDPALLQGMTGEQRRPLVEQYWCEADPHYRFGVGAETFVEFQGRVQRFKEELELLEHDTVIFGHGMWISMLLWKLLGFPANDAQAMRAFRQFQLGLPMPNCAVYHLHHAADGHWVVKVNGELLQAVGKVTL